MFKLVLLGALAFEAPLPELTGFPDFSAPTMAEKKAESIGEGAQNILDDKDAAKAAAEKAADAMGEQPDANAIASLLPKMNEAMAQETQDADTTPNAPEEDTAAKDDPNSPQSMRKRQTELARREQQIKTLEKEVDAKLVQLRELEASLQRMLEEAKEVKDKKLRHLIDVYANMKSRQAATVLESLDEDIAVKILAGMRGRQAGEILTFVNAEKAARLTEQLTKLQVPFQ